MDTQYLSLKQVCETLDVSDPSIRRYIRQGKLPAYKFGGRIFIKVEDLEAMMEPVVP